MNNRITDKKEMQALADQMIRVATDAGYDTQEIFFATALIMSWTLCNQTDETRGSAVNLALNMIKDGKEMFSPASNTMQ